MSSRRRRVGPSLASYIGLVRFYEEVEEQVKIGPYKMLVIAIATAVTILLLNILIPFKP